MVHNPPMHISVLIGRRMQQYCGHGHGNATGSLFDKYPKKRKTTGYHGRGSVF